MENEMSEIDVVLLLIGAAVVVFLGYTVISSLEKSVPDTASGKVKEVEEALGVQVADVELMGMTKKELIALAQERDILVSSRMRKAEIIEKIELK